MTCKFFGCEIVHSSDEDAGSIRSWRGSFGASLFASAADVAVLRNGFSIRHERREVVGPVTRLFLSADKNGYVDVPTERHRTVSKLGSLSCRRSAA